VSDLIAATRPSLIVELGTHRGESYFTFCQTVQELGLSCLCYAVDHWLGDEHAGRYGEDVFDEVQRYNGRYYRQFSYLLRTTFDDAALQFSDGSIDLLHIDGLHTYEAVSHDFRTWLPKVKRGGIILLHDICPRHVNFGVWRLWDEIKAEFPSTFEFHHSWGLGVVRKEGEARSSPLTDCLFGGSPSVCEEVRSRYIVYASHIENLLGHAPVVAVQVFPFGVTGYSEATSMIQQMEAGTWNTLVFELPEGSGHGPLRVDPVRAPSFVEIGDILIHSRSSGELLWSSPALSGARSLVAAGSAAVLPSEDGSFLISFGDDPQLMLTIPPDMQGALTLTISLRVSLAPKPAPEIVNALVKAAHATAELQVTAARLERDTIANELSQAIAEKKGMQELLLVAEDRLRREQTTRLAMQHSLSWRVTEPIRRLMTALRSGPRKDSVTTRSR